MKTIITHKAPAPGGHYSQAIQVGNLLFVSGQLPLNPATGRRIEDSIEVEAKCALANAGGIVTAAGGTLSDVAKGTLYIADVDDWPRVDQVFADFFGTHRPARAIIPCGFLHHGARIEVDAIACVPEGEQ
jgi:2-iminobutanoate/2-iminopropanoate deaminase